MESSIEADEIIAASRTYGFTQADIASAVGVTDRAVRDWLHDKPLRRGNEERLRALRQIVLLLDDSLSRRGVGQWFRDSSNGSSNGRDVTRGYPQAQVITPIRRNPW